MDACEAGALIAGHTSSPTSTPLSEAAIGRLHEATGRPVLPATAAGQFALEGYQGHGVFTFAVLDALSMRTGMGTAPLNYRNLQRTFKAWCRSLPLSSTIRRFSSRASDPAERISSSPAGSTIKTCPSVGGLDSIDCELESSAGSGYGHFSISANLIAPFSTLPRHGCSLNHSSTRQGKEDRREGPFAGKLGLDSP